MTAYIRFLVATTLLSVVVLTSADSYAARGNLTITSDYTLPDDLYGSIKIAASGVTLNCNNHRIIFDATLPNAFNCNDGISTCGVGLSGVGTKDSHITIMNCVVQGAFQYGMWLKATSFARISDSTSYAKNGFGLVFTDHVTLERLTASGNTLNGFVLTSNREATWASNLTSIGVGGTGFSATGSAGLILSYSSFNSGWGNGVTISTCAGGEVHDNQSHGNVGWGMEFVTQQSTQVTYNDVRYNEGEGMRFINVSSFNISNNTSMYNDDSSPYCDVNQVGTNSSYWSGNQFFSGDVCGTVPRPY